MDFLKFFLHDFITEYFFGNGKRTHAPTYKCTAPLQKNWDSIKYEIIAGCKISKFYIPIFYSQLNIENISNVENGTFYYFIKTHLEFDGSKTSKKKKSCNRVKKGLEK